MCDSKELLVSFLYDELAPGEREAFDVHLGGCPECRGEVAALRGTRQHLGRWAPPQPDLGFRVVGPPAAPPAAAAAPPRRGALWGLAAAAVLVLAAGAALANLELRYGADGVVLRTGWSRDRGAAPVQAAPEAPWEARAQALDRRVRELEASLAARPAAAPAGSAQPDEALVRLVNEIVARSEARQQRVVAADLQRLTRDIDARRRMDLALIDQGLMRLQTTSGAELRQSRDLMQRMFRAASYQPK